MTLSEIDPKLVELLKNSFDKIKAAPTFSVYIPENDEDKPTCKYRGQNDTKCVVGHMIADEHYHEDLEGSSVSSRNVQRAICQSHAEVAFDIHFLQNAQHYHDIVANRNPDKKPAETSFSFDNFLNFVNNNIFSE